MDHATRQRRRKRRISISAGHAEDVLYQRKRKAKHQDSFLCLFLRVASSLAFCCFAVFVCYRGVVPLSYDVSSDVDDVAPQDDLAPKTMLLPKSDRIKAVSLPVWNLTAASQHDAFALAERYGGKESEAMFWRTCAGLRDDFSSIYGGEHTARALLQRSMMTRNSSTAANDGPIAATALPSDLQATACRIQNARNEKRPFVLAFGGYSVTAGRGNYFEQSYPMVFRKRLHTAFHLLGIDLHVTNAAIGGCPAFPYGWCMHNLFGRSPDVVSWDFAMNEAGGDPAGLEAYLRRMLSLFPRSPPKLIVKDTIMATPRRNMLQHYAEYATDFVVVHTDNAVQHFLELPEDDRPEGFQNWRKFGAPPAAPGQSLHHPAVKEHDFIAWVLAMHFLSALEVLASGTDLQCINEPQLQTLIPPLDFDAANSTEASASILFGEPVDNTTWAMHNVHCRTSFEPILSGNLSDIAVLGNVGEDVDVMLPKSKMFYNRGWVLDMSESEKKAKRNLDRFGGLGFLDSKRAYYGIYTSKTLTFLLPIESSERRVPAVGKKAAEWFKSVVVCEANEKRSRTACHISNDVDFAVGGVNSTKSTSVPAKSSMFMGRKLCTHLTVPDEAVLTDRAHLQRDSNHMLPPTLVDEVSKRQVGLQLDVTVHNRAIIQRQDACSVSHVVWEEKKLG